MPKTKPPTPGDLRRADATPDQRTEAARDLAQRRWAATPAADRSVINRAAAMKRWQAVRAKRAIQDANARTHDDSNESK